MTLTLIARWLTTTSLSLEWSSKSIIPANSYFIVYRSDLSTGPFKAITGQLASSVLSLVDSNSNFASSDKFYYKVGLYDSDDDSLIAESPVRLTREKRSRLALEMVRRNNLLLKRFAGIRAYIFTKKSSGVRCSLCWDAVKERRSRTHCSQCQDTGYDSGLSDPIPALVASNTPTNTNNLSVVGADEEESRGMWTTNYPIISPGDILIFDNEKLYRIEAVSPIELRETLVSQQFSTTLLSKETEYANLQVPEFTGFDTLDLLHRQFGGMSLGDSEDYNVEPIQGNFSLDSDGDVI